MRRTQPRFDSTTGHLLDTADRLVLERGLRDLSLEAVSSEGFASTGSVYERWNSKWQLIDDLFDQRFERHWERLASATAGASLSDKLRALESTDDGTNVGTWIVEMLHLARVRPDYLPRSLDILDRFVQWCRVELSPLDDEDTRDGAQWWLIATVIGWHQLRLGGATMPSMSEHLSGLVSPPVSPRPATPAEMVIDEVPGTAPPSAPAIDDVSRRIVGVTRDLLAQAEGDLSVRSILDRSNVSSTTLYRRFESKRRLIVQVLDAELSSASYDWVIELADSLRSDDPIGAMSHVFRRRFETLIDFPDTRNVILELTAQARCDADLRRRLIEQVERMAELRGELFVRLDRAGILRRTLTPEIPGWIIQCAPAGYRLMVGAGIPIDVDGVERGSVRVLWNILDH